MEETEQESRLEVVGSESTKSVDATEVTEQESRIEQSRKAN